MDKTIEVSDRTTVPPSAGQLLFFTLSTWIYKLNSNCYIDRIAKSVKHLQ